MRGFTRPAGGRVRLVAMRKRVVRCFRRKACGDIILNKAILLVEDSALDVELVLFAARHCGVAERFVVLRDGREALDYLMGTGDYRQPPGTAPALVLLDLNMPRCDGFEVLKSLRATPALSDIAVVMMSSSDSEADQRRAALLGVRDYIVKTHDIDCLIGHVQRLSSEYLS
jgi:CheY-like chemotaxis protein